MPAAEKTIFRVESGGVYLGPGVLADCEEWLEGLAPHEPIGRYRHNRAGEFDGRRRKRVLVKIIGE
jgi:thiamine phosphate synthase YjbQ (UPF0047 family)